jgi:hypothetical protein
MKGEDFRDRLLNDASLIPLHRDTYCVYALWTAGKVVYVGYTKDLPQRIAKHARAAWADYEGYTFVTFKSKREALKAEADAIADLQPILNIDQSARRGFVPESQRIRTSAMSAADLAAWEEHCMRGAQIASYDMRAQIEVTVTRRSGVEQ